MNIYTFAKWQIKAGQRDLVLEALKEVAAKSSDEEGNLFYDVHQDNSNPNTLILFEGYRDEAALAAHRSSEHFQTLVVGKIVPLLENREIVSTTRLTL